LTQLAEQTALDRFVCAARKLTTNRMKKVARFTTQPTEGRSPLAKNLLRIRFAARLIADVPVAVSGPSVLRASVAAELLHAAMICHHDAVDHGCLGPEQVLSCPIGARSRAILTGDLFLCHAMELVRQIDGGRYLEAFTSKVRQALTARLEQELALQGKAVDWETWRRLAWGKGGCSFAFVAAVYGGDAAPLSEPLEEAGYHIGVAHQLLDDLIGAANRHGAGGGAAIAAEFGPRWTSRKIDELFRSALKCLDGCPEASSAVRQFFLRDFLPVLERHLDHPVEFSV
jgi:geranylgeranyl pyrophosphate synthase